LESSDDFAGRSAGEQDVVERKAVPRRVSRQGKDVELLEHVGVAGRWPRSAATARFRRRGAGVLMSTAEGLSRAIAGGQ
jgi:hypothetical protein